MVVVAYLDRIDVDPSASDVTCEVFGTHDAFLANPRVATLRSF